MEKELAIIARFALIFVYLGTFIFFSRNYKKSKESGFANKFFLGYSIFFFALFAVQIGLSIDALSNYMGTGATDWLRTPFPGEELEENRDKLLFLYNANQPLYIVGISSLLLLVGAQIYPVEKTIGWERVPGTIFLVSVSVAGTMIFIPVLTWSYYTFGVLLAAIIGILYGLIINVGVNIRLSVVSTGDLKRRSLSIIFASIFFYLGFIFTLEIQEISLSAITGLSISAKWDIVAGSVMQAISAILYWRGLRIRT